MRALAGALRLAETAPAAATGDPRKSGPKAAALPAALRDLKAKRP